MKHNVCCKVSVVREVAGFINMCTVCIFTYFWSDSRVVTVMQCFAGNSVLYFWN